MLSTILLGVVLVLCWGAGSALAAALLAREADRSAAHDAAVGAGLPLGLLLLAFPGWLASAAGRVDARVVLGLGLAALLAALTRARSLAGARAFLPAALVLAVFVLFLFLRGGTPEIRQTEKPMDAAVLSALLTTPALPLQDPWLAGSRFPYYHFGTLLAALPARLSGLPVEIAYNLLAALLPALAAGAAFAAVRLRGGSRRVAAAAAAALVLAGTPDGARQLLATGGLDTVELWPSSRRVAHAITEWPLFTFHLGDLHPHALSLPLLVLLAGFAGRVRGAAGAFLDGALLAALVSANPWDLPAGLLLVSAGALASRPLVPAVRRAAGAAAAALPFLVPFLLAPRPAVAGLRRVTQATTSAEAFLHLGAFVLLPALALGVGLVRTRDRGDERLFLGTLLPAAGIALSIVTGRPVLGLAAAAAAAALYLAFSSEGALRAGFLLLVAACTLAALPEVVAVRDPYGEELQRMNTLFKCWSAAAPLFVLSSALLAALPLATRRARAVPRLVFAAALLAAAVHPLALLSRVKPRVALDGAAWMESGDRAAVAWLRAHAPADAVLAEASGGAYDEHARIGTFSGRPTLLGWSGHERLWRGAADPLVASREADLRTIYTSRDEAAVRGVLKARGVRYVVFGAVERRDHGPEAFPLRGRFRTAMEETGGTALFEVTP